MTYRDSLPPGERYFAQRLESFGDIVVGFSMSLLALQLEIPKTPDEVFAHSARYAVFFTAFAVVSVFWIHFHRIMSTGFAPRRFDLFLLFAFLAFVALTPYALLTYTRLQGADQYSPQGLMLYLAVFLGVIAFGWLLTLRGMRRAWAYLDAAERRRTWGAFVSGGVSIPFFAAALAIVALSGARGFNLVLGVAIAIPLARHVLRQPWRWLVGSAPEPPNGTLTSAEVS